MIGTRGRGVEVTLKCPTILLCLLGVILKRWLKVHNLILQSWAFSNQTITTLTPANRMIHDLSFANIKNQTMYCSSVQHLLMMDFLFFFISCYTSLPSMVYKRDVNNIVSALNKNEPHSLGSEQNQRSLCDNQNLNIDTNYNKNEQENKKKQKKTVKLLCSKVKPAE